MLIQGDLDIIPLLFQPGDQQLIERVQPTRGSLDFARQALEKLEG